MKNPYIPKVLEVTQMYAYVFWNDNEIELIDRIKNMYEDEENGNVGMINRLYAKAYAKYGEKSPHRKGRGTGESKIMTWIAKAAAVISRTIKPMMLLYTRALILTAPF